MNTFQDECKALAPLQTFDPIAFQGDEDVPQKLCSFVLSLALIYNDCKNAIYAGLLLRESKPKGMFQLNALWGTYSGIDWHLFRLLISYIHELFCLIRDHGDILNHPFLIKVIKQLNPTSRNAWQSLVSVAIGATPKDDLGRVLLNIRNRVVFHYDPKGIYRGFRGQFLDADRPQDRAFISRGLSMSESRFYFADAAVVGHFQEVVGKKEVNDLSQKVVGIVESLNLALLGIVDRFIQKRGFAYRSAPEPITK